LRFAYLSTIEQGGSFNFGDPGSPNSYPGLRYTQISSENLTWEVARKQNLGFDINILNNTFSLTLDLYQETRRNIYVLRGQLPAIVGVSAQPWANIGKMDNRGIDGNFAVNKKIRGIDFTLRGNFTYYKNKILERDEQHNVYPYLLQQGYRADQTRGLI